MAKKLTRIQNHWKEKNHLLVAYQAIALYLLPYEDRSDSGNKLDEIDKRLPHFLSIQLCFSLGELLTEEKNNIQG